MQDMPHADYTRSTQALLLELNASLTRKGIPPSDAKQQALETHLDALSMYKPDEIQDALIVSTLRSIDNEGNSLMENPKLNEKRLLALQTAKNALLALQNTERMIP